MYGGAAVVLVDVYGGASSLDLLIVGSGVRVTGSPESTYELASGGEIRPVSSAPDPPISDIAGVRRPLWACSAAGSCCGV